MDFLNAIILLLNYIFMPALAYGSQLALGAIFVTLIYGILRFANFATGDMMAFGTMVTILFTWYFQSIRNFFRCFTYSFTCNTFCNFFDNFLYAFS